jgi:peptidoglycan/LPS O-acetylase OafA/YrhL
MTNEKKIEKKARFYEIDMLRFLAAMSVVLFHYTFRAFAADNHSPFEFPHWVAYSNTAIWR